MARTYDRRDGNGKETMVGLNAQTEPRGVVEAVFRLFDHYVSLDAEYPMNARHVLMGMRDGEDMSMQLFREFTNEYQNIFGDLPTKQYGARRDPILLNVGSRHLPPKCKKWSSADWEQWNKKRAQSWCFMILEQMERRRWTTTFLHERFEVDLSGMITSGYTPVEKPFEDRVMDVLNALAARLDEITVSNTTLLRQNSDLRTELTEVRRQLVQILPVINKLGLLFSEEEQKAAA